MLEKIKIKEPFRSILITLYFLATGVLSVMSTHFADLAKTPAGWTLWDISSIICPILFVGGIIVFGRSKGRGSDVI
jgi:hypothetical protein